MATPLNLLLIDEPSDGDGPLIGELRRGGFEPTTKQVRTKPALRKALKLGRWDAVISNFDLKSLEGPDAFATFNEFDLDLPFIFVADAIDFEAATRFMAAGAHDFICRGNLPRLVPALTRELRAANRNTARHSAHQKLDPKDGSQRNKFSASGKDEYQQLFDTIRYIPTAVALFDAGDGLILWNERYDSLLAGVGKLKAGMAFEDILRMGIEKGNIPDAAGREEEWIRLRVEHRRNRAGPIDIRYGDRWVVAFEHDTQDGGTILFAYDVTEKKVAEQRLQESEGKFRTLVEGSITGTYVHKDFKIVFANETCARIFGCSGPDDVLALDSLERLYPPEEWKRIAPFTAHRMAGNPAPASYEVCGRRIDGSVVWLEQRAHVIDWEGEPAIQCTLVDISDRKKSEEALRKSEARLRGIIDNSPSSILVKDRKGRFEIVGSSFEKRRGLAPGEAIGKKSTELFLRPLADHIAAIDRRVLNGETISEILEIPRLDGANGECRTFLSNRFPIPDKDGNVDAIGVINTDITEQERAQAELRKAHDQLEHRVAERTRELQDEITERKKVEAELKKNESWLCAIIDNSPAAICLKDTDGRYVLANREFLRSREISIAKVAGKRADEVFLGKKAEGLIAEDKSVIETGKPERREVEFQCADGTAHTHLTTKFPVFDSGGSITGIGVVSTDITERKQAEEALREREAWLSAVVENSPTAITLKDRNGRFSIVNKQWERQQGVPDTDLIGKTVFDIFPQDVACGLAEYDDTVIETLSPVEYETEILGPDGLPQTNLVVKFPVTGPDSNAVWVGCASTNITERKRAEEALRWSERDLRGILDNMVDTFFRTDRDGRIIMVSPSVTDLLGISPEEALGREATDFLADPGSKENFANVLNSHNGELVGTELRFRNANDQDVWVLATARHYFDEDGDVAGIEGVAHDITMRKRAEQALRRSEDRFRDFAEASSDWMWELDAEYRFTYISDRIRDVIGLNPKDAIGKNRKEIAEGTVPQTNWRIYDDALRKKTAFRDFEYWTTNDASERKLLRVSGKPVVDDEGTFLGYRGTGTNITQQRETEEREARIRRQFLDAIETVPVAFALFDAEDKLALWNNLYSSVAAPEVDLKVGMPFETIVRTVLESGGFVVDQGDEEKWLQNRLKQHRNPRGPFINQRENGWFQIREHTTPDGSTLLVTVDISDLRKAEESLRESERHQKAILDNISDIAWLKDREHRFIATNEAFAKFSGLEPSDLLGKTTTEIWPRELAKGYMVDDDEVITTGRRKKVEEILEGKDGKRIWVETIKSPVFDETGHATGSVGTARDITERKETELTLRKLSAAVEQSPASIFITDTDEIVEYANPRYFKHTGADPSDVIGSVPDFLKADEEAPEQIEHMWRRVKSGREWRGERRNRRKNGDLYWSSLAISPITNSAGEITNFLGISEDTTDRRRMDAQLRHAQKLEAVGTLAGGVAHDFNNILTGVMGHCYIAVEKLGVEHEVQFNLEQIKTASERARDLVAQLLAFSRRREADLRPVFLQSVVDEAIKLVHASTPSTITINWRVADNAGTVMVDPTQVHQVILNLCSNAAGAIGDTHGTIDVSVENVVTEEPIVAAGLTLLPGNYARLLISDTGCGMDAYTRDRAFDPFFTTKPVGSGTGLGLAAVHGIVEEHGGGVQIESEVGQGTTISIYLPCANEEEAKSTKKIREGFGGTERILLIDDERMVLQSIGPYLEHFGYEVEALTSGLAALAVFQSMPDHFDLVVTDQVMPGMTGDNLALKLREIRPEIPIILCTGYKPPNSENDPKTTGIDEVVRKPVEPSELGYVIRKTLNARGKRPNRVE